MSGSTSRAAIATVVLMALAGCSPAGLDAITMPSGGGGAAGSGGSGGGAGPGSGGRGGQSVTCPATVPAPGDTTRTVQVGTMARTYVLHVPSSYTGSAAVPLIVDFHGIGVTASRQRTLSTYPAQTDPEGVIMAFPSGATGPMGAAWNVGPCCVSNVDDVAFTRAVVMQVEALTCIDPARVYAVGFSMGGGMAYRVACDLAGTFAAIAPSAFDLLQENADGCLPSRPITVVSFRGTADTLVPYAGGYSAVVPMMPVTFLGAQATFQKWAQLDGCSGAASTPDANGCATYPPCQGGVQVTLCTKQGGGQEQSNATIAWPILKQHPL